MARRHHQYEGENVIVTYDAGRCIHAAECVRTLPAVFDPEARPWVDPDGAPVEKVVETVHRCPTGALQAQWQGKDTADLPSGESENLVTVAPDGPLYARGALVVQRASGEEVVRDTRVALCRCGASKIKPFCDGSHAKVEFHDPGAIEEPRIKGEGHGSGTLTITVAKDGPLMLKGPMKVLAGTDSSSCTGEQAALCRCGASATKPFCDGSHVAAGFADG